MNLNRTKIQLGLSVLASAMLLSTPAQADWTMYTLLRLDFAQPRLSEKLPTIEVAQHGVLTDFNLTGKTEYLEGHRFQSDADVFFRRSWNYQKRNLLTGSVETSDNISSDNPVIRLALNEIYFNGEPRPGMQYTAGKKRVLWGTGFAANPTDLLNPLKNPLDPTYERRGAWLVQAENVQEKQTFGILLAPAVTEDKNTLPEKVGRFSDADGVKRNHYLIGARWYQLLGGADVTLMGFYSERFKDERTGALLGGASWSQIIPSLSKQLEMHAEVLGQRGTARPDVLGNSRLDDRKHYFKTLLGVRYDFENESALVVEYLNQTDGDTVADLQSRMQRVALAIPRFPTLAASTLSSIVMRNTLFMNYQRYKFTEDLFMSWAVAHNLHDSSGFQGPIVQWTPNQSTQLTLSASADYNLVKRAGPEVAGIGYLRTNELNPIKSRLGLEYKSYF